MLRLYLVFIHKYIASAPLPLFFFLYSLHFIFISLFLMPSTHLTRGLVNYAKLCQWFDKLLTLLENMSDETFWNTLLGERVLNLLKRYFGSDVVCLGFIVYLARKL